MDISKFEIDAKLLEQFSCLGTDDKDDLIKAFKCVVGTELPLDTIRFFLELANWNLQKSIGAYFDYSFEAHPESTTIIAPATSTQASSINLPQSFLYDAKFHYLPNPEIKETPSLVWCVQNTGTSTWPENAYVTVETDPTVATAATCENECMVWLPLPPAGKIPIVSLSPGSFAHLSVDLQPPTKEICLRVLSSNIQIVGALRLCLPNGNRFGEPLYCTAIPDVASRSVVFQVGIPAIANSPSDPFCSIAATLYDTSQQAMDEDS